MRCNSMQQGVTYSFKTYYTPKLAIVWQTTNFHNIIIKIRHFREKAKYFSLP